MKTTILLLSTSLMFITSIAANNSHSYSEYEALQGPSYEEKAQEQAADFPTAFEGNIKAAPVDDQTIADPEALLHVRFQKSIQELIEQDQKIIEAAGEEPTYFVTTEESVEDRIAANAEIIEEQLDTTVKPLYLERTIEEIIAEDHAIIESSFENVEQPLQRDTHTINPKLLKKDKLLF